MHKRVAAAVMAGCLIAAGCENPQERARFVKAPLESADATSLASVNDAVREARTRLMSVRSRALRDELSQDIDNEYQRMLDQIHERERLEAERAARQAERQRLEAEAEARREAVRLEKEREARESQNRQAADTEQKSQARKDIHDLVVGTRFSLFGDGTQVLVLQNPRLYPVPVNLRCYTLGDVGQKTIYVTVPGGGEKHVGFMQGWPGNFKPGERCEALYEGEVVWNHVITTP